MLEINDWEVSKIASTGLNYWMDIVNRYEWMSEMCLRYA